MHYRINRLSCHCYFIKLLAKTSRQHSNVTLATFVNHFNQTFSRHAQLKRTVRIQR